MARVIWDMLRTLRMRRRISRVLAKAVVLYVDVPKLLMFVAATVGAVAAELLAAGELGATLEGLGRALELRGEIVVEGLLVANGSEDLRAGGAQII